MNIPSEKVKISKKEPLKTQAEYFLKCIKEEKSKLTIQNTL